MREAEFDAVADGCVSRHAASIRFSGETPECFARYNIDDVAREMADGSRAPSSIPDFGAGIGNALPHLAAALPDAGIVLLDPSVQPPCVAEKRFPGAAVFRGFDGRTIPYGDDRFDLVFTACAFHHIPAAEHGAFLGDILRVLRSGGGFFVFERNPRNPLTRRADRSCPFDLNAVLIDAADMAARVAEAGFLDLKRVCWVFSPGRLAALRPPERFLGGVPIGGQSYIRALKPYLSVPGRPFRSRRSAKQRPGIRRHPHHAPVGSGRPGGDRGCRKARARGEPARTSRGDGRLFRHGPRAGLPPRVRVRRGRGIGDGAG